MTAIFFLSRETRCRFLHDAKLLQVAPYKRDFFNYCICVSLVVELKSNEGEPKIYVCIINSVKYMPLGIFRWDFN